MDRLSKDAKYAKVAVFRVDFDSSKDLLRQWKVGEQSTLLAFKGKTEQTRSVSSTEEAAIRKVFDAAL